MQETLGAFIGTPWLYALIAASVLLDVFLPVLPSGVLVITAATAVAGTTAAGAAQFLPQLPEMALLVLCAAAASVLGDVAVYRLAWRGGERLDRAIARSRRLTAAQERLGQALVRGGGALVVLARFAPAGRSVVSLTAGAAHRRAKEFVPWSALAGLAWAAYSVGLGYLGSHWLGTAWLGTAVSVLALFAAGSLAAYVIRRRPVDDQPATGATGTTDGNAIREAGAPGDGAPESSVPDGGVPGSGVPDSRGRSVPDSRGRSVGVHRSPYPASTRV